MIRAVFHVDPCGLAEDEWARLFSEAAWIEGTRITNMAKIFAKLFDSGNE